jgi:hypothetical protein
MILNINHSILKLKKTITMRVLICYILCYALIGCTMSKEKKAEDLIKEELSISIHDFASYEPVKFGRLDSGFTDIKQDLKYIALNSAVKRYSAASDRYTLLRSQSSDPNEIMAYVGLIKKYTDSMLIAEKEENDIATNYKPTFNGWVMMHSFRSKNTLGAFVQQHYVFHFDPELTKVTGKEDLSEKKTD